jgi:hypothetical protein
MSPSHRIAIRCTFYAAGIIAAFGCSNEDDDIDNREDLTVEIISCEEAYARLEDCCPGFDAELTGGCVDHDVKKTTQRYCSSTTSWEEFREKPSMSKAESQCVRDRSCAELVHGGVCDRAQKAGRRRHGGSGSSSTFDIEGPPSHSEINEDHPSVCP